MTMTTITIATRKSPLAFRQSELVKEQLEQCHPDLHIDLAGMLTTGDKFLATPLAKIGGKALFVKELEKAMLERQADIAVHSIKDMPADLPDNFVLATICQREDPRDAFVSNHFDSIMTLPPGAIVGTSSLRRQAQLLTIRPDIKVQTLRGNVNTRLRKLDEGLYDAIIVASVGLDRLNMSDRIRQRFSPDVMLPGAGQGAIGIECRGDDEKLLHLLQPLDHRETRICITAERALTAKLNGSCQVPIAAYAIIQDKQLVLRGLVARTDGSEILQTKMQGDLSEPATLGERAADDLIQQGAEQIISETLSQN